MSAEEEKIRVGRKREPPVARQWGNKVEAVSEGRVCSL